MTFTRPPVPHPSPVAHCPHCGTTLDGGPVVFHCTGCDRGVMAADVRIDCREVAA